jgi:uncharacterized protein (TIGR00156 family)
MKKIIIALALTTSAVAAFAQYTGPGASAPATTTTAAPTTTTTVKQLLDAGKDDQRVVLRGHIARSVGDEKYEFTDGTGQVRLEIDHKRWPAGQPVSEKSTVELTGKYDKELIGKSKVEVKEIKVIQ